MLEEKFLTLRHYSLGYSNPSFNTPWKAIYNKDLYLIKWKKEDFHLANRKTLTTNPHREKATHVYKKDILTYPLYTIKVFTMNE